MSDTINNSKIELGTSREWSSEELTAFSDRLSSQAKDAFVENFSPDEFSRLPMKQVLDLASRFEYLNEGFSAQEITSIVQEELAHYQLLRLELARKEVASKNPQLLDAFDEVLAKFGGENLLFAISGNEEAIQLLQMEFGENVANFSDAIRVLSTVDEDYFSTDPHLEALKAGEDEITAELAIESTRNEIIAVLEQLLTEVINTFKGLKSAQIIEIVGALLQKIRIKEALTAVDKHILSLYIKKPIPNVI